MNFFKSFKYSTYHCIASGFSRSVVRACCGAGMRVRCSYFFPWFEDSELRRWSWTGRVFRASTRPQHVGPNNKNKHPGVELVPQCEDLNEEHVELPRHTVRGNPIPHSLFFSPFPSPFPPFSHSFLLTLFRSILYSFCPCIFFIL